MKLNLKLLIGIALVLMLCISPVAAVSGSDFEVIIDKSGSINTYTYSNKYSTGGKYIDITTDYTRFLTYSLVTFKPANIPDAPVMVVDTSNCENKVFLPTYVDKWEIKYYSSFGKRLHYPDPEYLDNAGVVSTYDTFKPWYWNGGSLRLDLGSKPCIWGYCFYPTSYDFVQHKWYIPKVN